MPAAGTGKARALRGSRPRLRHRQRAIRPSSRRSNHGRALARRFFRRRRLPAGAAF
jgi:hypothetical protein